MLKHRLGVAVVLLAVMVAGAAFAQDWPQWRGPNRDGKATGFTAPEAWPAALTQGWRVAVGNGDATPALVGDRLYVFTRVGEDELTTCLNAADGTQVWQDKVAAAPATGPGARHPGPRASVSVAEGKVVTIGVAGVISCLNAADGTVLWRKDPFPGVVPKFFTSASPMIVNGMACAHLGGPGNGAMIGFDLTSGEELGRWAGEGPDYASPVEMTVADVPMAVTLTEKSAIGVSFLDGSLQWQVPFVPQGRAYNSATPVVDGDTVYISGSMRGTKALKIAKQGETFTATEHWTNADVACQYCSPVLVNGYLYGLSDKGNFFCLNAADGKAAWVDPTISDKGSYCPLVEAGGVLFALPSTGELVVFKADHTAFTQLARYKVTETPVYAGPIVSGKRIFVKDMENNLTCWTLP